MKNRVLMQQGTCNSRKMSILSRGMMESQLGFDNFEEEHVLEMRSLFLYIKKIVIWDKNIIHNLNDKLEFFYKDDLKNDLDLR